MLKLVLIIEPDSLLRQALGEQLQYDGGFAVCLAEDAKKGLQTAQDSKPDAVILAAEGTGREASEVCQKLCEAQILAPILLIGEGDFHHQTSRKCDKIISDYIAKPFRIHFLLARLRTHLQQYENSESAHFSIASYRFVPSQRALYSHGDARDGTADSPLARLTAKESAVLRYLCQHRQQTISRARLLDEIWGYNAQINTHTLETHIYRLRQKLKPLDADKMLLNSKDGYCLAKQL